MKPVALDKGLREVGSILALRMVALIADVHTAAKVIVDGGLCNRGCVQPPHARSHGEHLLQTVGKRTHGTQAIRWSSRHGESPPGSPRQIDLTYLGIKLLKADDFQTWLLSIEVMGESLYKVI